MTLRLQLPTTCHYDYNHPRHGIQITITHDMTLILQLPTTWH